jgi:hypothetical protein
LAIADDDIPDTEEQLKTLEKIDDISRTSAVDPKSKIRIILTRAMKRKISNRFVQAEVGASEFEACLQNQLSRKFMTYYS